MFVEQIPIFQEDLSVRRNTPNFSRNPFFQSEQISIFQEAFSFCYRTADIKFSGDLFSFVITDRHFPGRYPPSEQETFIVLS